MVATLICIVCVLANIPGIMHGNPWSFAAAGFCGAMGLGCLCLYMATRR